MPLCAVVQGEPAALLWCTSLRCSAPGRLGLPDRVGLHAGGHWALHMSVVSVSALGEATCSAELLELPGEQGVCRQSPALQHSAVAENQIPLFYKETGELSAVEEALSLEPFREPSTLLQLQVSQAMYMLSREDVLLGLPLTCLAAQSVEEMPTQVATIQQSSGLLAEPLETLPAAPPGCGACSSDGGTSARLPWDSCPKRKCFPKQQSSWLL